MADTLFSSQYFCVALTIGAYALGSAIQKKWALAVLNPIVLSAFAIIGLLLALDVPNSVYQEGCELMQMLLTPATICLAISFYEQFQNLKKQLPAILLGVSLGTICCLGSIWGLCILFGLDRQLTVSLLPKSITAAMGVPLSQELGGIGAITTATIALTGSLGNIAGPWLCRVFRITDPIAQGVAFGTGSHVIGTTRAQEMSALAGAVGSFSLTIAGLFTVIILSFLAQFL